MPFLNALIVLFNATTARLRKVEDFNSIVGNINSQCEKLAEFGRKRQAAADKHYTEADRQNDLGDEAVDDAVRASRVAGKLQSLVA